MCSRGEIRASSVALLVRAALPCLNLVAGMCDLAIGPAQVVVPTASLLELLASSATLLALKGPDLVVKEASPKEDLLVVTNKADTPQSNKAATVVGTEAMEVDTVEGATTTSVRVTGPAQDARQTALPPGPSASSAVPPSQRTPLRPSRPPLLLEAPEEDTLMSAQEIGPVRTAVPTASLPATCASSVPPPSLSSKDWSGEKGGSWWYICVMCCVLSLGI